MGCMKVMPPVVGAPHKSATRIRCVNFEDNIAYFNIVY
jgi:hypothetical protein